MKPIESEELAAMANDLKGKKIEVWEMGEVHGLISEVISEGGRFLFHYIPDGGQEQGRLGGSWSWASIYEDLDVLHISVPMVGSAVVHL